MTTIPDSRLDLSRASVKAIADALAERTAITSPWMNAEQAAAYLAAPVSRIRKLTSAEAIPHHDEGRRVLYHRDELDQWVREGGGMTE